MSDEALFLAFIRRFSHIGYGRMMEIISHEWWRHDPIGAFVARTCFGLLPKRQRATYEAIAREDPLFQELP